MKKTYVYKFNIEISFFSSCKILKVALATFSRGGIQITSKISLGLGGEKKLQLAEIMRPLSRISYFEGVDSMSTKLTII